MIAYFAPLITGLMFALAHKFTYCHDEQCVLFIHEPIYKSRKMLFLKEKLIQNGVVNDVVAEDLFCPRVTQDNIPIKDLEEKVVNHYNTLFKKTGYSLDDFSKIYVIDDNQGTDFTLYFNIMKIRYTWLQVGVNDMPSIHLTLNRGYVDILRKYNAVTPYAEYADACFRSDSIVPSNFNKPYSTWDAQQAIKNINDEDMHALYECFQLNDCNLNYINSNINTLVIQNSYGYLTDKAIGLYRQNDRLSIALGFNNYTFSEIFSIMDKVSLDFYAPDTERTYIKAHINEILIPDNVANIYQNNTMLLPNIFFQILERYFVDKGIKFDNVIGTASTSIDGMPKEVYDQEFILGYEFSRTWWVYLSLYTVLIFAKANGFKKIYADTLLSSQLKNLSDKLNYGIDIIKFEPDAADNIKNSVIVVDLCDGSAPDFPHEKTDKSNAVAFINDGLSDRFIKSLNYELYTPISIIKDMITEPVCDILYRKETVWVYSGDPEIRRKARRFKFERELKFLGMRIHADGITLPEAVERFCARKSVCDMADTNKRLAQLEKKAEYMKLYIQKPPALLSLLKSTVDIDEYLDIIDIIKHNYVIMLAVRDTPGNCLSPDTVDRLKRLGFANFTKQLWVMYAGMLGRGNIICDKRGNQPEDDVEFIHTDINTGIKFELRSQAWRRGNKAELIIGGKDCSANIRGINLAVYDPAADKLIDAIGYDRHNAEGRFVRKNLEG